MLVVEKEASFQRLMDDNVLQKLHPCIVITVSTRALISTSLAFSHLIYKLNILGLEYGFILPELNFLHVFSTVHNIALHCTRLIPPRSVFL